MPDQATSGTNAWAKLLEKHLPRYRPDNSSRWEQRKIIASLGRAGLTVHDHSELGEHNYPSHYLFSDLVEHGAGFDYQLFGPHSDVVNGTDYEERPMELLRVLHDALYDAGAYEQMVRLATYGAALNTAGIDDQARKIEYVYNCIIDAEVPDLNLLRALRERGSLV